ncbi:MAG TPA: GNAT family N-acetyltransferase [Solirubrobacteraceae bacterium]|nr:GNAT family N-acetyltransferase [Solirubrobacteraceae bacterium]
MSDRFTIRPATTADLGMIADSLVAGLSTYRGWTPVGWNPPQRAEMLIGLLQRFPRDGSWAHLAFAGSQPAGHISLRPERDEDGRQRTDVALLTQLFVHEEYWGSGLAAQLNAIGRADMVQRGFSTGRLLVARGHKRARAFYEREGWRATGEHETSGELGLELAEYLLDLG